MFKKILKKLNKQINCDLFNPKQPAGSHLVTEGAVLLVVSLQINRCTLNKL